MVNNIDKLILVPGHAPFKDSVVEVPNDFREDKYWVLQEFQTGEPVYYCEHIEAGAKLAARDSASLLLFSGGRTRQESERWSEAATYKAIYDKLGLDTFGVNVELEEYARDSFENLEFSLYQFYRRIGRYPIHVTIAGWKFKADRFLLHAKALGIPSDKVEYVGVNNPENLAGALIGEERVLAEFAADPFGGNAVLSGKRLDRNPFSDVHPYEKLPPIVVG